MAGKSRLMEFDLGMLGGGQLGRMSILAAHRLGIRCVSLDPDPDSPAAQVGPSLAGKLSDPEAIENLVRTCARITFENEFVPVAAVTAAFKEVGRDPDGVLVPGLACLGTVQDKLLQRQALAKAGVPCPKAVAIDDDGTSAVAQIGFPMVLKARFGGYDGRGTRYAKTQQDLEDHRSVWQDGGWLAEQHVDFVREVAVMVCRPLAGPPFCFPTMETVQVDHQCDLVYPCDADGAEVSLAAVEAVGGAGLFGVELFEKADGSLVVNEIAPRPHNSGHYTLDWGGLSQFDAHVRLALGIPVAPDDGAPACMANLIGQEGAGEWRRGLIAALVTDPSLGVHWYGKRQARPKRKMGHINAVGGDAVGRAKKGREAFYAAWTLDATAEGA